MPVRVEAHAEAELVHALRVVVLIPEERQDDHRLAEVEALGDRVVAAVRDHEVGVGEDRRLREELRAAHVVRELVLIVLRPFRDDEALRAVGKRRDEPSHQVDVGRAEAAERKVDERAVGLGREPVPRLARLGRAGVEVVGVPPAVDVGHGHGRSPCR